MDRFLKKGCIFLLVFLAALFFCSCGRTEELKLSSEASLKAFELPDFEGRYEGLFEKLLADKLGAFLEVSKEAEMKKMPFCAIYSLSNVKGKDFKKLNVTVLDNKKKKDLLVYDLFLDVRNKSVRYNDAAVAKLVEDKDFLKNYILLKLWGMPLEAFDGEKVVTRAEWVKMLVSAFESFAGFEIESDRIDESITTDRYLKKALEIDIIEVGDIKSINEPIKRQEAIVYYLSFVKEIEKRLFSHSCQTATVTEAKELLTLVCKMQKNETGNVNPVAVFTKSDKPLTRIQLADIIMAAYERLIPSVPVIKGRDTLFTDTKSTSANKAVSCGVMNYFANNNTFLPHKELQFWEVITPLKNFVKSVIKNGKDENRTLNYRDSVELLAMGLEPFALREKILSEDTLVLNERPYDWYCNQLETGEYSKVNCVPSCVEMAICWRDKDIAVTAELLRERTPADGHGWNGRQMTEALRAYGIDPESHSPVTLEALKDNLDRGAIIILMINEGAANEGHAVVIKGYRQNKAGLWFILNDPYSSSNNKYGMPSGKGREIEGEYLAFLCARFTNTFFVISPKQN